MEPGHTKCQHDSVFRFQVLGVAEFWGMLALGVGALRVLDLTRVPWVSLVFRLWLQLVCCAYLLTLSEYLE